VLPVTSVVFLDLCVCVVLYVVFLFNKSCRLSTVVVICTGERYHRKVQRAIRDSSKRLEAKSMSCLVPVHTEE
jgi:hypothetical protein